MKNTFKYFCFVAIINLVCCRYFGFDEEGEVVVKELVGKYASFPELKEESQKKLDEAYVQYIADRKDTTSSAKPFVVDAIGFSLAFTVKLNKEKEKAVEVNIICMVETKTKEKQIIPKNEGSTYTKIALRDLVTAQLPGDETHKNALQIGINHIDTLLSPNSGLLSGVDKDKPLGFRARLVKGTEKGKDTGVYLLFVVFFSKE